MRESHDSSVPTEAPAPCPNTVFHTSKLSISIPENNTISITCPFCGEKRTMIGERSTEEGRSLLVET